MDIAQFISSRGITAKQWLAGIAVGVILLIGAGWWIHGVHQRSEMLELLNDFAPIAKPAMEIQFAARQADTPELRALLAPGIQAGYWSLRNNGHPGQAEILLTALGQRYFSTVGNRIIAGFSAGSRVATRIESIRDSGSSRELAFLFTWNAVHPATSILGENTPAAGHELKGEAILVREGDGWKLAHWTLPDFEAAQAIFK